MQQYSIHSTRIQYFGVPYSEYVGRGTEVILTERKKEIDAPAESPNTCPDPSGAVCRHRQDQRGRGEQGA